MNQRLDFVVCGGKFIDDNWYSEDIIVNVDCLRGYVEITQDGKKVLFTTNQFDEFMKKILSCNLFYKTEEYT